tara:strand:+ start:1470 stop:1628 length:159 start_codon:yes stop_codon:yes gene_type:complete
LQTRYNPYTVYRREFKKLNRTSRFVAIFRKDWKKQRITAEKRNNSGEKEYQR